jgi:YD repeat-containing protein
LVIDPRIAYLDNDAYNSRFQVWKYPYILSRVDLSKTTNTEYCPGGNTIVKTKDYLYNTTNHQVSRIDENTSLSNQILRTRITYSADGTDAYSRWMKDAHRLNDVVETKTALVENGQEHCISTQRTNYTSRYSNRTSLYLPGSTSTSIGDNTPETRAVYSYDDSLNVCAIAVDGVETVYIWSYNGQYPIAKIEGLTYAEVKAAVGQSTISNLLCKAEPSDGDFNSIRNAVKNARGHITTYTYRPLVGITSETLPNGNTTYYEYDGFGRLTSVTDHNGSVISTNSYNYKAQ